MDLQPIAVLQQAVVLATKASLPTAVLNLLVVVTFNAL